MPGGTSKLHDVRKLADLHSTVDLEIPVAELPGLPVELISGGGPLHAHLQFGREQGHMSVQVHLHGPLQMVCQRCMEPMMLDIDTQSAVLLVESEADAENAPAEWETFLAPEGRASLTTLAAEELLLALPIVPLHAVEELGSCQSANEIAESPKPIEAPSAPEGTTRPFADLRALLERDAKTKR